MPRTPRKSDCSNICCIIICLLCNVTCYNFICKFFIFKNEKKLCTLIFESCILKNNNDEAEEL